MNKYKIVTEERKTEIMAADDFISELFAALCEYNGIDAHEIHTEVDRRGVWRSYVKDRDGDFIILLQRI